MITFDYLEDTDLESVETAKQYVVFRGRQEYPVSYLHYVQKLITAGIILDRTDEYKSTFRRCKPVPSIAERGHLVNTVSLLLEDTRKPGKLWHLFGGQCNLTLVRWNPKTHKNEVWYSPGELRHAGLHVEYSDENGGWGTKKGILAYMRRHYEHLPEEELRLRLRCLRPLFKAGKYTARQYAPLSRIKPEVLKRQGALVATKEEVLSGSVYGR
jgi:hypothetical protein